MVAGDAWRRLTQRVSNPSSSVKLISLLGGFVAGEVYSIYAAFVAQLIGPVVVFLIDPKTGRHLATGQIGTIEEVVNWSSVVTTVAISIVLFGIAWCTIRGVAAWVSADNSESICPQADALAVPPAG